MSDINNIVEKIKQLEEEKDNYRLQIAQNNKMIQAYRQWLVEADDKERDLMIELFTALGLPIKYDNAL